MRRPLRTAVAVVSLTSAILATFLAGSASAHAATDPWGPVHTLEAGRVAPAFSQATSSAGMTVVAFTARPRQGPPTTEIAVQLPGEVWGATQPLSTGQVLRPSVLAWGPGNVSVLWQTRAPGLDNWRFHELVVAADGTLGAAQTLVLAHYAYPWYQAAVNDSGDLALSWAGGDGHDRVQVRQSGTWRTYPAVPVEHPTADGTPFIANPLRLFLSASGVPALVTWGTVAGSGRIVWLARPTESGWSTDRIGPVGTGRLGYDWVPTSRFAADPQGDVAAVWSQQDPASHQWTTSYRAWAEDGTPTPRRVLSHLRCDYLWSSCGDVAMTADGSTLLGWAIPTANAGAVARFQRRDPNGVFSPPQSISTPLWSNTYQGIELSANASGDAVVSFTGGTHQTIWSQFARCPATAACEMAQRRDSGPSWLDSWQTSIGPAGGSTVTWHAIGGAGGLFTRRLATLG